MARVPPLTPPALLRRTLDLWRNCPVWRSKTAGSVRLTANDADGSTVAVETLYDGSFVGLNALMRQPNFAGAYALEEVSALELDREHLELSHINI